MDHLRAVKFHNYGNVAPQIYRYLTRSSFLSYHNFFFLFLPKMRCTFSSLKTRAINERHAVINNAGKREEKKMERNPNPSH